MQLTLKQESGVKEAIRRYKLGEKYTVISGFAGTGKSTIVKIIISALNIHPSQVIYTTYTGKASLVLREKGCDSAITMHKLLYNSFKNKNGTFSHIPKRELDYPWEVVVVDEVSMVPKQMLQLLIRHNVHIICLGDPFQLPPIGEDNGILSNPHVFLDEIMRQAKDSEIIDISMRIRQGDKLSLFNGEQVQILKKSEMCSGMFDWADQILCGKNETRKKINLEAREFQGRGSEPENGDKIICLKNEWETMTYDGDALVNGSIGFISNINLGRDNGILGREMRIDFIPEFIKTPNQNNIFLGLQADYNMIKNGVQTQQRNSRPVYGLAPSLKLFDYGTAITVHKSQGSQYNKVMLIEERLRGDMHDRWVYTGVTRAVEKLLILID